MRLIAGHCRTWPVSLSKQLSSVKVLDGIMSYETGG